MTDIRQRLISAAETARSSQFGAPASICMEAAVEIWRLRNEVAEWKQAAGIEAGLHREFLARAEAAEAALRAMPLQDHAARPASEYDPSMGSVLWWKFPISEPPYVGNPDDCGFTVEAHTTTRLITQMDQDHDPETTIHRIHAGGWPGYHTHFTLIAMPAAPAILAEDGAKS